MALGQLTAAQFDEVVVKLHAATESTSAVRLKGFRIHRAAAVVLCPCDPWNATL